MLEQTNTSSGLVTDPTGIVDCYRNSFSTYSAYVKRLEPLLADLSQSRSIKVHQIDSRAKSIESVSEKIKRPGKEYHALSDIEDLAGVRIILYYQDDIVSVQDMLSQEFEVLSQETAHQQSSYEPNQFGYLSMHYVLTLGPARASLAEWSSYASLKAEVQVRTVLQHGWAAVSHAMQYKREADVPRELRRRLFRLAGLFELADTEFMGIRDAGLAIAERQQVAITTEPSRTTLDVTALDAHLKTSPLWARLMEALIPIKYDYKHSSLEEEPGMVTAELEQIGPMTVEQLNVLLAQDHTAYFKAIHPDRGPWFVSKTFLLLLLLIRDHPEHFSLQYLIDELEFGPIVAESVVRGRSQYAAAQK